MGDFRIKNGNLYQEIKSSKKDERVAYAKYTQIFLSKEKELEDAIRSIEEKYKLILNELNGDTINQSSKLWHLAGIYRDYGTFCTGDITKIIVALLTYVEGEKFIRYINCDIGNLIIKETVNNQYDKIDYDLFNML